MLITVKVATEALVYQVRKQMLLLTLHYKRLHLYPLLGYKQRWVISNASDVNCALQ